MIGMTMETTMMMMMLMVIVMMMVMMMMRIQLMSSAVDLDKQIT